MPLPVQPAQNIEGCKYHSQDDRRFQDYPWVSAECKGCAQMVNSYYDELDEWYGR